MIEREDQGRREQRQEQVARLKTELENPDKTRLVLTRELGESIVIGGGITVTVNDISPNRVILGITAPKETPIFRKELLEGNQPNPGSEPISQ